MGWYGYGFRPYVPVARRRANAARAMAKLAKKGQTINPVKIDGRQIARTFWGQAWCDNLESYSDYENRLPRGRTYVRNGSVVDLQVHPGKVTARVSGSELYTITIKIKPLNKNQWQAISTKCAGQIASVVELLQGRLSQGVMEIITHRDAGLFPKPAEISLDCSCPDWADMCKHVAAALYGVGARLDEKPELLFTLRQVDHFELIEQAASGKALAPAAASGKKTIAEGDLAEVFGIELDSATPSPIAAAASAAVKAIAAAPTDGTKKSKPHRAKTRRVKAAAKTTRSGGHKKTGRRPISAKAMR
ncbi:MAG: SWIM zinc finger family protein [Phycisphaerae bacterium]|nr:SWIM zinc finger family protein [Phycisphaerae bacterium]